jgi:1-acyl-sn-glycerol-3-phosphate acyltransferase
MKVIAYLRNSAIIVIALTWTIICGLLGIIMMLFIWNGRRVQFINARYLWSPLVCFICRIHVRIHGRQNIDKTKSAIYVANHSSYLDILAISRVMPKPLFFVGKKELGWIPVLGLYMWMVGHFFVDRKNHSAAMSSMRKAARKIQQGYDVIVFAEGTRSAQGKVGRFRRGAFIIAKEGMIDIVPVAVIGAHKLLPKKSFLIRKGNIEVSFGSPITSTTIEEHNDIELASITQGRVVQLIKERNNE